MLEFLDKLDRMEKKIDRWLPRPKAAIADLNFDVQPALKSLADFERFAENLYIRSGTKLVPFSPLFGFQAEISRLIDIYPVITVIKDRQLGLSELIAAKMLHRACMNSAYAGACFSLGDREATKISNRVRQMPNRIPGFEWDKESTGIRQPAQGGEINFLPTTEKATRSFASVWDLFFDEAGFVPGISEMYAASSPSQEMVGENARTFVVSTIPPQGRDCWFWNFFEANTPERIDPEKMLKLARDGGYFNNTKGGDRVVPIPGFCAWEDEGGGVKIVVGHKAHPIYGSDPDYLVKLKKKKGITEEQLQREHNLGLPKQGGILFDFDAIARNDNGGWLGRIYNHHYLLCCDPNFGAIGGDYFVVQIWDITNLPYQLVHEYKDNTHSTVTHRQELAKIAAQYRPILAAVESNGGGNIVAEGLAEDCSWLQVEVVNSSNLSKRINTDRCAIMLENDEVSYPDDWDGINEMKKFSTMNREAIIGHDDTITCWAAGMAWAAEASMLIMRTVSAAVPTEESSGRRAVREVF